MPNVRGSGGERVYGWHLDDAHLWMRDHDGTLSFRPRRAPEDNAILRFPVTYRGQLLEVEISLDKVEYALREGERLVIRHETEGVELTRENPRAFRPLSRR